MERNDTIRKIKNLLELAGDNPNENEAKAAALAAQRLIAKHDIKDSELMTTYEEAIKEIESGSYKGNPWAVRLGRAIADNFRCRMYLTYNGTRSWYTNRVTKTEERVVFMGYETDAIAATETFNHLYTMGNRLADKECRAARAKYGTARGVKNSFLLGYVDGIKSELEKQCKALVLVTPAKVSEYADNRTSGFATKRTNLRNAYDSESYDSGVYAGRSSMRQGALTE